MGVFVFRSIEKKTIQIEYEREGGSRVREELERDKERLVKENERVQQLYPPPW